jgi:hypothetical protein
MSGAVVSWSLISSGTKRLRYPTLRGQRKSRLTNASRLPLVFGDLFSHYIQPRIGGV